MKLIAKKPCSFGGKNFYIGDEIPANLVLNPKTQEKMSVLAIVSDDCQVSEPAAPGDAKEKVDTMAVVIHAEEGDLPLDLTAEGLQAVVDVLTSKAEEAEAIVKQMEDGDALILLHIADTRKTIKVAAESRAKALNSKESEGEQ